MRWLFLKGMGREQGHTSGFFEAFRNRWPGADMLGLDLPGAGTEHRRASPDTVRGIAEDVRSRWLPARGDGDWGVIAVSLGGMVAMEWCAAHPGDFIRTVLVNTSSGGISPPWRRLDLRVLPGVVRALAGSDPLARERRVLAMTTRLRGDLDALAARYAAVSRERPMSRGTVLAQLRAGARFRAPDTLPGPVLVLSSRGDRLTHPSCPRALAARFGAALALHPDAGHDLPLDDPAWVAARVAEWAGPKERS
ncbi:alpha/beta hydrolase [Myxococcota bacterium]|nr:alpha/beta hydrolase [Myxococcota bacterium]